MQTVLTEYHFPQRIKGSTFKALKLTLRYKNGPPVDLTGAAIKIQFRKGSKTGKLQKEISNTAGLTINDAAAGVVIIDSFLLTDWAASVYYYDTLITFSDQEREVYFGGTFTVEQNVTL